MSGIPAALQLQPIGSGVILAGHRLRNGSAGGEHPWPAIISGRIPVIFACSGAVAANTKAAGTAAVRQAAASSAAQVFFNQFILNSPYKKLSYLLTILDPPKTGDISIPSSALSMASTSAGLRLTSAAPAFSFSRSALRVPGIGTI